MRAHFNTSATAMVDIYLYIHPVQVPQWPSNFGWGLLCISKKAS